MAIFEREGFCPNNSLGDLAQGTLLQRRSHEILGARKAYIVYDKQAVVIDNPYIIDLFLGDRETTLGLEIAVALRELIPHCVYAETGKKILVFDIINPVLVPEEASLYEDSKYLVGLVNSSVDVKIYIYKK